MKFLEFERILFDKIKIHVQDVHSIPACMTPTVVWLQKLQHAIIVFPNKKIFNCNPRRYTINRKYMLFGLDAKPKAKTCQVEPSLSAYDYYFKNSFEPFIENDQNCVLWSFYYLEWYLVNQQNKKAIFPRTLRDLEMWCTFKIWFNS